jgi:hypothetical protein
LQSKELNALVHVHNSIVNEQSHPVLSNAMQISLEVLDVLLSRLALNDDCKELFVLLQRPNLQVRPTGGPPVWLSDSQPIGAGFESQPGFTFSDQTFPFLNRHEYMLKKMP